MLIYDVETSLLLAWLFSLGDQVVRHNQLVECAVMFGILTISYKWYGEKKVTVLKGKDTLEKFDKIARTADVIIGKNNFRFDDKRINTERMLKGLPPFPEWSTRSDDLESQLRKYFSFPSYSLDAISKHLGLGGKKKMEFDDWVRIAKYDLYLKFMDYDESGCKCGEGFCKTLFNTKRSQVILEGKLAYSKMGTYNGKDVLDTEAILIKVLPYIKLKKNASAIFDGKGCILCGSTKLIPTKIVTAGQTKYQEFTCLEHNGYGGRATYRYDKQRHKQFGKVT